MAGSTPRLGVVAVITIVVVLLLRFFVIPVYEIPSMSMAPTLTLDDRVLVNRFSYSVGEIQRGQVIVFDTPPTQESEAAVFIKRVVALPGETVRLLDDEVYVDGLLVVEPYLARTRSTELGTRRIPGCAQPEPAVDHCVIPDGHVFVMGDNRGGSEDSRVFGPIPVDTVVGRAMLKVWPLSDIQRL